MAGSTHLHGWDRFVFVVDYIYDYQVELIHFPQFADLTFSKDVPLHSLHRQSIARSFIWRAFSLTNIYVIDLHV